MEKELFAACLKDLGRCEFLTKLGELDAIIYQCHYNIKNLDKFMSDVHHDTPLLLAPNFGRIKYEPLGVALVLGSWNYPYMVCLKPLV